MRAVTRLAQVEYGATGDDFPPVAQETFNQRLQVQRTRLAVDERDGVDAEHRLHLRVLVKVVQQHFRRLAALQVDDHAHAVLVGLVAQFADAGEALLLDQFGDFLEQAGLVDLVRQLGDHNRRRVTVGVFDFRLGAHVDAATPGAVGLADARGAVDDAGGREVGTRDVVHQVFDAQVRVVDEGHAGVDHFPEVVRRDVRRHAHGDAARAVDEQVRDTRRQHRRFAFLAIVIGDEMDGFAVDVGEQLAGDALEAAFRVAHRRGGVAVDRTEIALAVDQHVAQREILRHAHQRVVDRVVAVRVVLTHHLADDACALHIGAVPHDVCFMHGKKHTAVYRFEPVSNIWQRPAHDYAHRVIHVGLAHLVFDVYGE